MANQLKNRKSHKTDALMRLLMSGSGGAVNPSVSVTFKEDIIRPINDKKQLPKQEFVEKPQTSRITPPEIPQAGSVTPLTQKPQQQPILPLIEDRTAERHEAPPIKFSPERPAELDIVRELIKELLPTAIQRFNVCYCDTCYSTMTEAIAKRSPKIVILARSKDDLARAEYLKKQNRNNVLRTVIKEVLDYKTTGKHNNSVRI
jgi:hypothetical protein